MAVADAALGRRAEAGLRHRVGAGGARGDECLGAGRARLVDDAPHAALRDVAVVGRHGAARPAAERPLAAVVHLQAGRPGQVARHERADGGAVAAVEAVVARVEERDASLGKRREARGAAGALGGAALLQQELRQGDDVHLVAHELHELLPAAGAHRDHAHDARRAYLVEDALAQRGGAVEQPGAHERASAAVGGERPGHAVVGEPPPHRARELGRVAHQRAAGEEQRVRQARPVLGRLLERGELRVADAVDGTVGAEDVPLVVHHHELGVVGRHEPGAHEQHAPVAHALGRKHMGLARGRAEAAEAAAAQRVVELGAVLHELQHGGGLVVERQRRYGAVALLHLAHVQVRLLQHLAAQRAALAVRAGELLVRPGGQHIELGRVQAGDLPELLGREFFRSWLHAHGVLPPRIRDQFSATRPGRGENRARTRILRSCGKHILY